MPRRKKTASLTKLQAQLVRQLLDHIQSRGLVPGEYLNEASLAQMLQVSRTPISAALAFLAERDILTLRKNVGYFVRLSGEKLEKIDLDLAEADEDKLHLRIVADHIANALPEQFSEADLMRRYGVSRGQLLRVLQRMAREGAVERNKGYGWRFLDLLNSIEAHDESYHFRLVIEPAAILAPTFVLDRERASHCRRQHEPLLAGRTRRISSIELFEINANFHEMLAASSGNRFFLKAIQQQNQLRRFLNYHWVYGKERIIEVGREHMAILDAIEGDERELAAGLMRRHLTVATTLVPATLKSARPKADRTDAAAQR